MWKSAYVGVYQLLNWKMHGETLKEDGSCECSGLHSNVAEVSFLLRYDIMPFSNWHLMFWDSMVVVSKGLPRQAEVAQGVPGRLRARIFLTFRHDKGGRSSAKRTGHLYPRRNPWYSLSEAESTSGHMVLFGVPQKKSPLTPLGIDPGTVRLVAQCLNHYATPGPARW